MDNESSLVLDLVSRDAEALRSGAWWRSMVRDVS